MSWPPVPPPLPGLDLDANLVADLQALLAAQQDPHVALALAALSHQGGAPMQHQGQAFMAPGAAFGMAVGVAEQDQVQQQQHHHHHHHRHHQQQQQQHGGGAAAKTAGGARPRSRQGQRKRKREPSSGQAAANVAEESVELEAGGGEGAGGSEAEVQLEAPAVDRRAAALNLLQQAGASADRAARALQETEEQCANADPAGWAEEAQFWLACNAEFEDERDRLAEAMHASLAEAEERRAQEVPLEERSPEEIATAFRDSALLRALRVLCSLPSLLEPPLKPPLLRYLQLEKRCGKWYPLSRHYFRQAAADCIAALGMAPNPQQLPQQLPGGQGPGTPGTSGGVPDQPCAREAAARAAEARASTATAAAGEVPAAAATACGRPNGACSSQQASQCAAGQGGATAEATAAAADGSEPSCSRRSGRVTRQQQRQQQQHADLAAPPDGPAGRPAAGRSGRPAQTPAAAPAAAPQAPPLAADAAQVLAALLVSRCDAVEGEVYAMPSGDGASVPALFLAAAEGHEDEEEMVEVLDD